jgi:hypothetical protein
MGSNSPYDLITGEKSYTIKDIIKNITCPTLVLEAENDDSFPEQPKRIHDGLSPLFCATTKHIENQG